MPRREAPATYLSRWQDLRSSARAQARRLSRRRQPYCLPLHAARRRPSARLAAFLGGAEDRALDRPRSLFRDPFMAMGRARPVAPLDEVAGDARTFADRHEGGARWHASPAKLRATATVPRSSKNSIACSEQRAATSRSRMQQCNVRTWTRVRGKPARAAGVAKNRAPHRKLRPILGFFGGASVRGGMRLRN